MTGEGAKVGHLRARPAEIDSLAGDGFTSGVHRSVCRGAAQPQRVRLFSHGLDDEGDVHAFLWQDSVMQDLGTLPGGHESEALGINAKGQVVGTSYGITGYDHWL